MFGYLFQIIRVKIIFIYDKDTLYQKLSWKIKEKLFSKASSQIFYKTMKQIVICVTYSNLYVIKYTTEMN